MACGRESHCRTALILVILLAASTGCKNPFDSGPRAAAPTFDPPGGTYGEDLAVSLATTTAGAGIRYTTDGSEPSAGSSLFVGPIPVSLSRTLRAAAFAPGYTDSEIASAAYVIDKSPGKLLAPTFSLPAGTYHKPIRVGLFSSTSGAVIRYTLDGSVPTASSQAYASPLAIGDDAIVRAVACREGWEISEPASAQYSFSAAMPIFSPPQGLYSALQIDVAISSDTQDAGIVYTLDGSDPSATNGFGYEDPITLTSITTVKAIALRSGWADSEIVGAKLQPGRLAPSDCGEADYFGSSLALSRDGSILAIGTPGDDVVSFGDQGSVRVYELVRGSWIEKQRLVQSVGMASTGFGNAIAISSDGACIVVGAPSYTIDMAACGVAHVFTRSGASWIQAQTLSLASPVSADSFGDSVAVSDDGSVIVVGAPGRAVGGKTYQGTAHIFVKSGSTWSETQEITSADGDESDCFGYSIDIAADANEILVGAIRHTVGSNDGQGAVYSFARSGGTWSETQELTAIEGAAWDTMGVSVSVSEDGLTAAIGAAGTKVGLDNNRGAAYVFDKSGGTWTESARLLASDGKAEDQFGAAVDIEGSGNIVIGAYSAMVGSNPCQGAAYLWTYTGGAWNETGKIVASDGAAMDYFGGSVAVSAGIGQIVIGAVLDTVEGTAKQGSVYLFPLP